MLVDYREVYRLLLSHLHVSPKAKKSELHDEVHAVLEHLVRQFFSRWDVNRSMTVDSNAQVTLAYHDQKQEFWEHAGVVTAANTLIGQITSLIIPGFRSWDDRLCAYIRNVTLRPNAVAHLEIDPNAIDTFLRNPYSGESVWIADRDSAPA